MNCKRLRITIILVVGLMVGGLVSAVAGTYIPTKVVSGTLTSVSADKVVLEGKTYYASSAVGKINTAAGTVVSLRYYVDDEKKNILVAIKDGAGSIKEFKPPVKKAGEK